MFPTVDDSESDSESRLRRGRVESSSSTSRVVSISHHSGILHVSTSRWAAMPFDGPPYRRKRYDLKTLGFSPRSRTVAGDPGRRAPGGPPTVSLVRDKTPALTRSMATIPVNTAVHINCVSILQRLKVADGPLCRSQKLRHTSPFAAHGCQQMRCGSRKACSEAAGGFALLIHYFPHLRRVPIRKPERVVMRQNRASFLQLPTSRADT